MRRHLLSTLLKQHKTSITKKEYLDLGRKFDGYSFSDLTNLCKEASMSPIRELSANAVIKTKAENLRAISYDDVAGSARFIRPSTTRETLLALLEWDQKYGASG